MWRKYHSLRTSEAFLSEWKTFLLQAGCPTISSIFVQFVGHSMFKELVKTKYCQNTTAEGSYVSDDLTHLEYNAIRYTAGYVPRALKKKVAKSHHSNKKDLLLCLNDLSMCDDDDDPGSSADWIRAVDRGSLIHINNMTFELFLSMEQSIRRCVKAGQELGDARSQLKEDENILFYWSILTANQSNDVSTTILEMVLDLWITVRGFSLAGAWVEEYKITQKKTTQKSKALRKQLN